MPNEIVIDASTNPDLLFDPQYSRGAVPRDFAVDPIEMFAPPSEMVLIPRSEWSARIKEMEATKTRMSDLLKGRGIEPLDQNGQGFCWAYSTGMAIMAATFSFLQLFYMGRLDPALFYVLPFLFLETAILAALALWLSTLTSWPLAWFLSVLLCLLGNVKFPLYASLMARPQSGFNRLVIEGLYHLLPNLESFNFKDALVHHLIVPAPYLWQTAAYGICYTAALLTLASMTFARKEL